MNPILENRGGPWQGDRLCTAARAEMSASSNQMSSRKGFNRLDADFASGSERCAAWLYLPAGADNPPIVVMGHGFAAERDFRLPAYAEAFASRGYAVLLFDYRGFGSSAGSPRQLVSPRRHLADWQAAVDHVRSLPQVDATRMVLWGSSFGGGHALVTAARNPDVAGVIAQVPYVESVSTLRRLTLGELLQAVGSGIRDLFRALTGRAPYTVPVYANPGEFACMNTPESAAGYAAMVPAGSAWTNACPARIFLTLPLLSADCVGGAHRRARPAARGRGRRAHSAGGRGSVCGTH